MARSCWENHCASRPSALSPFTAMTPTSSPSRSALGELSSIEEIAPSLLAMSDASPRLTEGARAVAVAWGLARLLRRLMPQPAGWASWPGRYRGLRRMRPAQCESGGPSKRSRGSVRGGGVLPIPRAV